MHRVLLLLLLAALTSSCDRSQSTEPDPGSASRAEHQRHTSGERGVLNEMVNGSLERAHSTAGQASRRMQDELDAAGN